MLSIGALPFLYIPWPSVPYPPPPPTPAASMLQVSMSGGGLLGLNSYTYTLCLPPHVLLACLPLLYLCLSAHPGPTPYNYSVVTTRPPPPCTQVDGCDQDLPEVKPSPPPDPATLPPLQQRYHRNLKAFPRQPCPTFACSLTGVVRICYSSSPTP
jgi:hypothetical protein